MSHESKSKRPGGKQKGAKRKSAGRTSASRKSSKAGQSPVERRESRKIPALVRVLLAVQAGGRCEFCGCNRYLFEHPLTLREGNFAQVAHIVGFSTAGPRGGRRRGKDIHALKNLMLLCPACHKEIDDHPTDYSVQKLRKQKSDHERRIRELTAATPDMRTVIVQLRARIGGQHVDIPAPRVREAIAPRYAADRKGHVIDLMSLRREDARFFEVAAAEIRRDVEHCLGGFEPLTERHFSVFALAPIPLLVVLGHAFGDKVALDVYQRHRDTQTWKWKAGGQTVAYRWRSLRAGKKTSRPMLVLALSGEILDESWPNGVDKDTPIYEITLEGTAPSREFLRTREDLLAFNRAYASALAMIGQRHPVAGIIDVLPAVPAPVAIALGRELLPKVHPELRIHDNVNGRFEYCLSVNEKGSRASERL